MAYGKMGERQLRQLADGMAQVVWITDPEGNVQYFNELWAAYTGWTLEKSLGFHWTKVVHPYDRAAASELWRAALRAGKPFENEHRSRRFDGSYRWQLVRAMPIKDEESNVTACWFVTSTDIHDAREAEQALHRSEERYARTAEAGKVGIWELNLATNDLYIASNLKGLLGYTDEELPNHLAAWYPLVHPDDKDRILIATDDYLQGRTEKFEMEVRRRHKDGTYRWFLTRGQVLRDSAGVPYRMLGSDTEITEQKTIRDLLREREELLRAIIDAPPECVKVVSASGKVVRMNSAGLGMIEAGSEDLVCGRDVFDLVAPEYRDVWQRNHERVCAGENLTWQFECVGLQGTRRWMETHAVPICLPDGEVGQLSVTREITARKKIEAEHEYLFGAEAAGAGDENDLQDEFLSTLSHELRTALNAIIAWTSMLRSEPNAENLAQGLEVIERNARVQAQLVSDLLDMSRIILGKIRVGAKREDLSLSIATALETIRRSAVGNLRKG